MDSRAWEELFQIWKGSFQTWNGLFSCDMTYVECSEVASTSEQPPPPAWEQSGVIFYRGLGQPYVC